LKRRFFARNAKEPKKLLDRRKNSARLVRVLEHSRLNKESTYGKWFVPIVMEQDRYLRILASIVRLQGL